MENHVASWGILENADVLSRRNIFAQYCKDNIALHKSGTFSIEQAAYNIVAASQFPDLSSAPEFKEIFDISGSLEIADHEYDEQQKHDEWNRLVELIANLKSS